MALRKCPRCELNYILDDGSLCTVCREEVHGRKADGDDLALCSLCGEMPAMPGEDLCAGCLREMRAMEQNSGDDIDGDELLEEQLDAEPVSGMDELDEVDDIDGLDDEDTIEVDDGIMPDLARAQ